MKEKESIICYDINIVPLGITLQDIIHIAKETGYLLYDSSNFREGNSKKPYLLNPDSKSKYIITDTSTEEGKEILKSMSKINN